MMQLKPVEILSAGKGYEVVVLLDGKVVYQGSFTNSASVINEKENKKDDGVEKEDDKKKDDGVGKEEARQALITTFLDACHKQDLDAIKSNIDSILPEDLIPIFKTTMRCNLMDAAYLISQDQRLVIDTSDHAQVMLNYVEAGVAANYLLEYYHKHNHFKLAEDLIRLDLQDYTLANGFNALHAVLKKPSDDWLKLLTSTDSTLGYGVLHACKVNDMSILHVITSGREISPGLFFQVCLSRNVEAVEFLLSDPKLKPEANGNAVAKSVYSTIFDNPGDHKNLRRILRLLRDDQRVKKLLSMEEFLNFCRVLFPDY